MSEYIRKAVKWEKQDVYEYGGDGEHAGSFEDPDFVNIQRAKGYDCVVAEERKTGYWYWFRRDDTLLPWADLRNDGACEVEGDGYPMFLDASYEGPFASEAAAKRFATNYVRREIFDAQQNKKAAERSKKAHEALQDVLGGASRR